MTRPEIMEAHKELSALGLPPRDLFERQIMLIAAQFIADYEALGLTTLEEARCAAVAKATERP